ncbi:alpha/beta fold hydrolase [Sphingomonas sp. 32-62-10]|nr:MAG: haloalkane dehalogenase [Sphingomonas sp. 32-62-10]
MIEAKRTPDERFKDVPDFDFPVRYVDDLPGYEGLRGAYIDAGPADADRVFLCQHGEPSWSFLYRRMIPVFLETGARVICPDFLGFGRSDKPVRQEDYSFDFHRNWLLADDDLGGRQVGRQHVLQGAARLFIGNCPRGDTGIGTGASPGPGFMMWKAYAASTPDLPIGALIARGTPHLTPAEIAAYEAPYPDASYKAGAQIFPALVPIVPDMPGAAIGREAVKFWSERWSGPSFMAVGAADPVLGPTQMEALRKQIRGCPEPMIIPDGGHFVQEWGEPIARAAIAAFGGR